MEFFGWLINGILWFFAFESSKGSFASMVGYRILYGVLLLASIAAVLGTIWLLFGHVTQRSH